MELEIEKTEVEPQEFDDFNLKDDLLRGIYSMGFERPSPIQRKAIAPLLLGRDVIAQAQSGTGKTGTFSISALQRLDVSVSVTQTIIMEPTHELARQTAQVVERLGIMMDGLRVKCMIGGNSVQEDTEEMRTHVPHVVVGTPGRIFDMIKRGVLKTQHIALFVLDEADDMLCVGFKDQIHAIFQHMPSVVQVALFSATMPPEILDLTKKFMQDPVRLIMKTEELNLACINQYFVALSSDTEKYEALKRLFGYLTVSQCIIYANSVPRVQELCRAMVGEGFSVCCIHSSMTKDERDLAFHNFKNGQSRVLISTNITARGIDIQQVSVVINYDVPSCVHTYLHRIGRSGRWGRKGTAINFVTRHDIHHMKHIESHYKSCIQELPLDGDVEGIMRRI